MEEFLIAPAGARPFWVLVPLVVVVLGVIAVLGTSVLASRTARFDLSPDALRLRGDLYGRTIPMEQLATDAARQVDLNTAADLRPVRRTFGTGLPGYRSGWFRLANGDTALLYVTDGRKAVYIPTTAGFSLLLSPDDPDGFLAALRTHARSTR